MSNGKYSSVLHRAVLNNKDTRVSVVVVNEPALDNEIGPVPKLLEKEKPLFRSIKYGDYFLLQQNSRLSEGRALNQIRRDVSLNHTMRYFFKSLVTLQGIEKNLNENCTRALSDSDLCFFPQYALKYISKPYFILNSAYDVFQFHHILVPPSADPLGHWRHCRANKSACTPAQMNTLQGFRRSMLAALKAFYFYSNTGGMFINSCFAHCQSESRETWFGDDAPRINNKTIAEAVGDWYFSRNRSKHVDCPCDNTCHNLIP